MTAVTSDASSGADTAALAENAREIAEKAIVAALRRVFDAAPPERLQPVSERPENRSWFVTNAGRQFVAKLPETSGGLTAGAALEYRILRLAAGVGVAPAPLGFDAQTQILFVAAVDDARVISAQDASNPVCFARVAEMLRVLHAIPAPAALRPFDVAAFAARYGEGLEAGSAIAIRAELVALHAEHAALIAGSAICHNDLHGANILSAEQLWLIDFEYAVRAAPVVDIASFAAMNGLDAETAMTFAAHCLGSTPAFTTKQLGDVMRMQALLAELWEIARSGNNARL